MDPTVTTGTRKTLTRLDLAFLNDIGWQTVAFPLLPGDFNQDNRRTVADIQAMMSALANVKGYETSHGFSNSTFTTIGDLNGDGLVNNRDLQSLISLVASTTGGAGALQMVPEPGSLLLWVSGGGFCLVAAVHRRRKRNLQREGTKDAAGSSMAGAVAGASGVGGC
jgi:Dockerin type I domain